MGMPSSEITNVMGYGPVYQSPESFQCLRKYIKTSLFLPRVRARALRAPVFLGSLTRQKGRYAPPPSTAASLLLILQK